MEAPTWLNDTSSETGNISDSVGNVTTGSVPPLQVELPTWCIILSQILISLVFIVGVLGNILLLAVFKRNKDRPSTTIYIIWLAVANLVTLSFNGPIDFLQFTSLWSSFGSIWVCKLHIYMMLNVFANSAFLIFCIGLDRFLKVYRPHSSMKLKKISKIICPLIFGFSVMYFLSVFTVIYQDQWGRCYGVPDTNTVAKISIIILNFSIIASSFPLCFFYFKIAQFIRGKSKVRNSPEIAIGGHSTRRPTGKAEGGRHYLSIRPSTSAQEHVKTQVRSLNPTSLMITPPIRTITCASRNSAGIICTAHGHESTLTPIESVELAHSVQRTTLPDTGNKYTVTSLHAPSVGQGNNLTALPSTSSAAEHVPQLSYQKRTNKPRSAQGKCTRLIQVTPVLRSTSGHQDSVTTITGDGQEQNRQTNRGRQTTVTMAMITVVFFLTSVFPAMVFNFIIGKVGESLGSDLLKLSIVRLPFLNYASNAILYSVSSSEFRKNVRQLFQDVRAKVLQHF